MATVLLLNCSPCVPGISFTDPGGAYLMGLCPCENWVENAFESVVFTTVFKIVEKLVSISEVRSKCLRDP